MMSKLNFSFLIISTLFINNAFATGIEENQPPLTPQTHTVSYPCGEDINFPFTLTSGFSGAEGTHRWTDGKEATMNFPLIDGTHGQIQSISFVDTFAFLPATHTQHVTVTLNGSEVGQYNYIEPTQVHTITVNIPPYSNNPLEIIFDMPHATKPLSWSYLNNPDGRTIGIGFRNIKVTFTTPFCTLMKNKFGEFLSTQHPTLLPLWNKTKQEKEKYFDTLPEPEQNAIIQLVSDLEAKFKKETQASYHIIQHQLDVLKSQKDQTLESMNEHKQKVQNALKSKAEQEKSIKDLLVEFETFVCSFAKPDCSSEQLELVKKVCSTYLKDIYNLKNVKTKIFRTTEEEQQEQEKQFALYDSFISNICTAFNIEKYTLVINPATNQIGIFNLRYFQIMKKDEWVQWEINFYQDNYNKQASKTIDIDNKVKSLQTPAFFFLKELDQLL